MTSATSIGIENIKYDLHKIIEPWDGIATGRNKSDIFRLFRSYFLDLRAENLIKEFKIYTSVRDRTIQYDISVKFSYDTKPVKIRLHVNQFVFPWTSGGKYARIAKRKHGK